MPYNISLFVSDGVVSVHWKLSVSTEIGRTQFWWYEILGILILIPHMIYYIHITIDYTLSVPIWSLSQNTEK